MKIYEFFWFTYGIETTRICNIILICESACEFLLGLAK